MDRMNQKNGDVSSRCWSSSWNCSVSRDPATFGKNIGYDLGDEVASRGWEVVGWIGIRYDSMGSAETPHQTFMEFLGFHLNNAGVLPLGVTKIVRPWPLSTRDRSASNSPEYASADDANPDDVTKIWWFVSIFSRIEGDGQPLPHESSWIRVYLHLLQVPFIMVGWPGVHMSCSLTMARMRPRHFDGWARRFLHDGALFAWGKQKPSLHEVYPKLKEIGWFPSKSKSLIQHRFC